MMIHNGVEEPISDELLAQKWKIGSVYGIEKPIVPNYCVFNNTAKALKLLDRHIRKDSLIVLHSDVDVDGVGTTYIIKRALEYLGSRKHVLMINKDKIHGIQQKHADYFRDKPVDLVIITDSSCNETGIIKQFNCDVLCIDHHDLLHNDTYGKCLNGTSDYVIVNNNSDEDTYEEDKEFLGDTINFERYIAEPDMSCGLVVYELLRVYSKYVGKEKLLENLKLYQWVGTTLFTDAIDTLNNRNQWYLDNTVFSNEIEHGMGIMLHDINKFKATLDKTYIQYSLAPIINKAIRAGKSSEVIDIVINHPQDVYSLNIYNQNQTDALDKATTITSEDGVKSDIIFSTDAIMLNLSSMEVHPNYYGVIASRLCGTNNKSTAVFRLNGNKCKGSFRGKNKHINYRKIFEDYSKDIYAQGHPTAFGFELDIDQLSYLMDYIVTLEPNKDDKPWISLGNVNEENKGTYHFTSADELRRAGLVWKIATGNAKVASIDEILIRASAANASLKQTTGKVYLYDVLGFECKAFKPIQSDFFDLYIEYSKEINIFIR